jgi:Lsr2
MAQHVSVLLVDDLDGSTADRTVAFALDGRRYEIDLNAENERLLRAALEPFIAGARRAARPAAGSGRRRDHSPRTTQSSPPEQTRATDAPPEDQPPAAQATAAAAVPPAHFSNPSTHAATRLGTAARPGSVEIFTHRA